MLCCCCEVTAIRIAFKGYKTSVTIFQSTRPNAPEDLGPPSSPLTQPPLSYLKKKLRSSVIICRFGCSLSALLRDQSHDLIRTCVVWSSLVFILYISRTPSGHLVPAVNLSHCHPDSDEMSLY